MSEVFGTPITDSTLEEMPYYACKLRIERADAAINRRHEQAWDLRAREHGERLKEKWGDGIASICLIYNATGDTIKYVTSHDWCGSIYRGQYPVEIANGQWGVYLHVQSSQPESSAGVVYRGKNEVGKDCDWMLAWYNRSSPNVKAYTEIREAGHYEHNVDWPYIIARLRQSALQHSDTWNGCFSTVTTGGDTCPIFEAILTLKNAA